MTAGPTPLPPAVSQVMAEPILYHRAPAFVEVYARVLERLKKVFQTENEVLCFASSGSGGMESAVAEPRPPGRPAVVASCGKFGERWAELRGLRRRDHPPRRRVGQQGRARRRSSARSASTSGTKVVYTTLSRDLDRRRQRRPGADRGRARARRADRGRRRLAASAPSRSRRTSGAWTSSPPARRRRSCARPASASPRANRARARARRRVPGRPLLLRLAEDAEGPAQGSAGQPVHARRVDLHARSTSRSA